MPNALSESELDPAVLCAHMRVRASRFITEHTSAWVKSCLRISPRRNLASKPSRDRTLSWARNGWALARAGNVQAIKVLYNRCDGLAKATLEVQEPPKANSRVLHVPSPYDEMGNRIVCQRTEPQLQ